jgi:hypothetical protein
MKLVSQNSWCILGLVLGAIGTTGCSPKIYLKDRQTVLEDEAAGEWPEFEKELLEKSTLKGPTPFPHIKNSAKKERLYHVLNGEITYVAPSQ